MQQRCTGRIKNKTFVTICSRSLFLLAKKEAGWENAKRIWIFAGSKDYQANEYNTPNEGERL